MCSRNCIGPRRPRLRAARQFMRPKPDAPKPGEVTHSTGPRTSTGPPPRPTAGQRVLRARSAFHETHFDLLRARQMFERALETRSEICRSSRLARRKLRQHDLPQVIAMTSSWLYQGLKRSFSGRLTRMQTLPWPMRIVHRLLFPRRKELQLEVIEKSLKATPDLACGMMDLGSITSLMGIMPRTR